MIYGLPSMVYRLWSDYSGIWNGNKACEPKNVRSAPSLSTAVTRSPANRTHRGPAGFFKVISCEVNGM